MRHGWVSIVLLTVLSAGCSQSASTGLQSGDLALGQAIFEGQCTRCHGIEGTGGFGPNLNRPILRHAESDSSLFSVIKIGIPGTGMPATWRLSDAEVWHVAAYVRSLSGEADIQLTGDPENGELLFESTACLTCHIVRGLGNSLGPDLSDVGIRRGPNYLEESLRQPGAARPTIRVPSYQGEYAAYLPVGVITKDGSTVSGIRINEDTFSIQVRDSNNKLHSFRKRDIKTLTKYPIQSLMPSYDAMFTDSEINDVVAFLASLQTRS